MTIESRLKWHRELTHTNAPHCSSHKVATQPMTVCHSWSWREPSSHKPRITIPNTSGQQNAASQSHYNFPQSPHSPLSTPHLSLSQSTPPLVIYTCQETLLLFPYKDKYRIISAFLQISPASLNLTAPFPVKDDLTPTHNSERFSPFPIHSESRLSPLGQAQRWLVCLKAFLLFKLHSLV